MNFVRTLPCFLLFICFSIYKTAAQPKTTPYSLQSLLADRKLDVHNRDLNPLNAGDKAGVALSARENDGVAWLSGVSFSNGIIELDMKGKDILQQSFLGIAFHGTNAANTEDVIYFRPFNFRAADPLRKIHAVQYVSLPGYDWELLRQKFNGQYEKAVQPAPNADEWFHAKIVVAYPLVSVYVNGNKEASLVVKVLSANKTGKIGLWVGNNSEGEFANLVVTDTP